MRVKKERKVEPPELTMAIGLVWGFLNVSQFDQAYALARGCLRLWPDENRLLIMLAYAAVELLEPLDDKMRAALAKPECREWADIVLKRAQVNAAVC